jgi:ParB-like chromosome segregation protein Spo0J
MKVTKKPLAELHPPERNVRMHTDKQLKEFRRSVEMFGQIRPIVVDEGGIILAGNGLFETLLSMGRTEADCYIVSGLTEAQKKKLMLADNKIFGLGVDDLDTMDAFLVELKDDLDIPGFDEDLLKNMVADAEEITETLQEYGTLDEEEVEKIKAAGERKDFYMSAGRGEKSDDPPKDISQPEEVKEPTHRYVVCPQCGEKIWV